MQFSIVREALLKALNRVVGAVERRQSQPILGNVLVSVQNQLLTLVGTDLELELIARVPLALEAQAGATTIPGKKLTDICKALPEHSTIHIQQLEQKVHVRSGRSRYTLASLPADDFPRFAESPGDVELSVSQATLRLLLDLTCFSMAHQDVRYYLNGLCLIAGAREVRVVATDGHRLATMALPLKAPHLSGTLVVILPRKAVLEMQRSFSDGEDEIGLVIGKNHLRAVTAHSSFITKLVEGKFPDYRAVFPKEQGHTLVISRELLRQALLRVSALFTDKYRGIGLQFSPGVLLIVATTPDKDEVEDEVEVDYQGPPLEIGLNASYLIEYLNTMRVGRIRISFISASHAVLFEALSDDADADPIGHGYVVMPMRL